MFLLLRRKIWAVAYPACRNYLASLIACWTAAKIRSVCSMLGEENNPKNDLHSAETKWESHVRFTDFSFWIVLGLGFFGGKVLLALVSQKSPALWSSLFSLWQESKGRNWLDEQAQPHWVVFLVVWWWQKHSCVQSSQLEHYAWQGNSRLSLLLIDGRFLSAGTSCLKDLPGVSERLQGKEGAVSEKPKGRHYVRAVAVLFIFWAILKLSLGKWRRLWLWSWLKTIWVS